MPAIPKDYEPKGGMVTAAQFDSQEDPEQWPEGVTYSLDTMARGYYSIDCPIGRFSLNVQEGDFVVWKKGEDPGVLSAHAFYREYERAS